MTQGSYKIRLEMLVARRFPSEREAHFLAGPKALLKVAYEACARVIQKLEFVVIFTCDSPLKALGKFLLVSNPRIVRFVCQGPRGEQGNRVAIWVLCNRPKQVTTCVCRECCVLVDKQTVSFLVRHQATKPEIEDLVLS